MLAFFMIVYLPLGALVLLMDSLTVQTEVELVFSSYSTFLLAMMLWPLVFIWAKYKWYQRLKG